jgi:hypothetical protein
MQVVPCRRTQQGYQRAMSEIGDLAYRVDAPGMKLGGRHRSHPPQAFHRQRMQELQLSVGLHKEKTVRLGHGAGNFGKELGSCYSDRDWKPDLVRHITPQAPGDFDR